MKTTAIKTFLVVLLSVLSLNASAQMVKVGYFSYEDALKSMPAYNEIQANIKTLKEQYDAELANAEKEFNDKYELFLEQQASMAKAIREKRQSELQLLIENNVAFRNESQRLLRQAEEEAMDSLRKQLDNVIKALGNEGGYIFLLNTDSNACPYIHPALGEDVTELIKEKLSGDSQY